MSEKEPLQSDIPSKPVFHPYRQWGFEWKSGVEIAGFPLIHVAMGFDKTGKLRVAKGWLAIGQFAIGAVTIAQFGIGFLFGFGQFIAAYAAIAQFALALSFGLGQFATGWVAIGQMVLAYYGLAQVGFGKYIWSAQRHDQEAIAFFQPLLDLIRQWFCGG